jgi:RNA polymerase sigma-70 factor (ECF subfamily)
MSTLNWNLFTHSSTFTSEADLMLATGDNRYTAFVQTLQAYMPRLLSTAHGYLRQEDDCRDAVQDALLSAYKNLHRFHGHSQLGTWLHRIVVNACLMKLRRQSLRTMIPIDDLLPEQTCSGLAEDHLEKAEAQTWLRHSLSQLSPAHQEIIQLRDLDQLGTEEVATRLNITPGAVKTRLHRAHVALKKVLVSD